MRLVLGIDGGGTRTRAWFARLDGAVLARGEAEGSNTHQLGVARAGEVLVRAATEAWRAGGLPGGEPHDLAAVFAGVAGAGAPRDQRALADRLAARLAVAPERCLVDHDLRIALAGGLVGAPGAVVVAGTGSACFGRAGDGRSWKAGGWGPVLDDGGSGHWLGVQAMRAVVRAADGREPERGFTEAVKARLGVATPRELLARLAPGSPAPLDHATIAALAPLVLEAAAAGDPVAVALVESGARELAGMAAAVLARLGIDADPVGRVAGTGGVLERSALYFGRVAAALEARISDVRLEPPGLPPVAGAVLLALEAAGGVVDPSVVTRLRDEAGRGAERGRT